MKTFNHVGLPGKHPEVIRSKNAQGNRVYLIEGESLELPSITSVLSSYDNDAIFAWRKRVGEEEANRVSAKASTNGTRFHQFCEDFLNNKSVDSWDRFEKFIPLLNRVDNIVCQEHMMATTWNGGIAGTVDCIAEFDGKLSIIDFKTSSKPKRPDWIKKYFVQETAYAIMFYKMYGVKIDNLVTLISVEGDHPDQVFVEHPSDHVEYLRAAMSAFNNG